MAGRGRLAQSGQEPLSHHPPNPGQSTTLEHYLKTPLTPHWDLLILGSSGLIVTLSLTFKFLKFLFFKKILFIF